MWNPPTHQMQSTLPRHTAVCQGTVTSAQALGSFYIARWGPYSTSEYHSFQPAHLLNTQTQQCKIKSHQEKRSMRNIGFTKHQTQTVMFSRTIRFNANPGTTIYMCKMFYNSQSTSSMHFILLRLPLDPSGSVFIIPGVQTNSQGPASF